MCRTCSVDGCNNKHLAKGYCKKHYWQFNKYGRIIDNDFKNSFTIWFDEVYIDLKNRKGELVAQATIDLEDWDEVKNYTWRFNTNGYVRSGSTNSIYLHQFIMDSPDDLMIDHVNGMPMDNRRSNLRTCTAQQNTFNKGKQTNNTSGVAGVVWDKSSNKWMAQIQINNRHIYLGRFKNKEDAIRARQQAEIDYFGEYRRQE